MDNLAAHAWNYSPTPLNLT